MEITRATGTSRCPSPIEEVTADEWRETVCRLDIVERAAHLYKKPGYRMSVDTGQR
jgi:hypothetical protein